jgi:dTDP-4-dehydrorhamnose reductase
MVTTEPALAVWGGLECSINRVCDRYLDQFGMANLYAQPNKEEVAGLGMEKLRFPVLWERHQPEPASVIDWSYCDEQLTYYRNQGIDVIATLVHHGSGPRFTNLLDPQFPYLLADYARQVAERFPLLEYYTPVNEPLTTARFSGLYGIWYPHHTSDLSFLRCLINELKGVVLSMKAIREVNPGAKLVQTEDLGKTYSTPKLRYQARFENERRWLTFDILCGRFNAKHPLWSYAIRQGIGEEELRFFVDEPCVPDIFGFNYYVTSERYLDERKERYPHLRPGGNGRHRYIDTEAARVPVDEPTGVAALLREAWLRYRQPMVLSEVHLHCHREEQLRWFRYIWNECVGLQQEGVGIQAITAWALMGSIGWSKLLTGETLEYEPGAFDLRGGKARPTALADFIRQLGSHTEDEHLAATPGWWQRDSRFFASCLPDTDEACQLPVKGDKKPILVIGKSGTLGAAFARICAQRCLDVVLAGREECDITNPDSIQEALEQYKPWAVINAAGYVRVDDAEQDAERCFRENHLGPVQLAEACRDRGIRLVSFSSDLVFDGKKKEPYLESDAVNPLNVYGESKALAERDVLAIYPEALMIRTSAFFGPWDAYNFLYWVQESLEAGRRIEVADDLLVSPTYVPDLVHATLDLLVDRERGIWHLANEGSFTWAELARLTARRFGLDEGLIDARPASQMDWPAARPQNSVLGTEKAPMLPDADNALNRYFAERTRNVELVQP